MTRRCSHCSNNGHNSRTCPTRASGGVRLFGVSLTKGVGGGGGRRGDGPMMKKSASMGCLSHYSSSLNSGSQAASPSPGGGGGGGGGDDLHRVDSIGEDEGGVGAAGANGYASDDPNHASCSSSRRGERKKGIPWTEEEHRMFLVGLQKLGKGDWRGIARNYVLSRTPTQVASHAQKYFIRQTNATRRKRRSSLFDMVPDMPMDESPALEEQFVLHSPPAEQENTNTVPSLNLTLEQELLPAEPITDSPIAKTEEAAPCTNFPQMVSAFYPAYVPVPFAFWPPCGSMPVEEPQMGETHEIVKPIPVLPGDPIHVDDLVGMSKLSLGEANSSRIEPSALSSKLLATPASRQSAFHVNPAAAANFDLNQSSTNAIHAV